MRKLFRYHIKSFRYAFSGLRTLLLSEHNMLVHTLATIIVIALGLWRDLSTVKWCMIMLIIGMVWAAEAINTAIERLCDVVSKEYHPLIKQVKDISSAAVLIAAITAVIIGILVFVF